MAEQERFSIVSSNAPGGDVVVVGSLNLDLVATTDRLPLPGETVSGTNYAEHPGGKGLNQAIAASRSGASTQMMGAVGDDTAGALLVNEAVSASVDTAFIATLAGTSTGRALINVDNCGENCIVVVPGANSLVTPDMAKGFINQIRRPGKRVLLAQLELPLDTVAMALQAGRRSGMISILDPAPSIELPSSLLANIDVITPNEHEVDLLGGVDHLLASGIGAVIVTLGDDGAVLHRPSAPPVHQTAIGINVVDTTGAGDAFRGALAARVAAGWTLNAALPFAAAAGALATTIAGAVPSLPTREAIEQLLVTSG